MWNCRNDLIKFIDTYYSDWTFVKLPMATGKEMNEVGTMEMRKVQEE